MYLLECSLEWADGRRGPVSAPATECSEAAPSGGRRACRQGNGLTEADISEMGLEKGKRPATINRKASNTIVWWQGRQNALDQKRAERRKKLRGQLLQTIRSRANQTIKGE
mmetsp:Transcript_30779/g.77710  ORF Transcript_30779/g.77710 Transcript_30779/m.77710 type:complete len:111 (+) Transcript_30779:393-725(+)